MKDERRRNRIGFGIIATFFPTSSFPSLCVLCDLCGLFFRGLCQEDGYGGGLNPQELGS